MQWRFYPIMRFWTVGQDSLIGHSDLQYGDEQTKEYFAALHIQELIYKTVDGTHELVDKGRIAVTRLSSDCCHSSKGRCSA